MVSMFNIFGAFFWLTSLVSCAASRSAMQETVAILQVLIGAVFFVGAALIDELRKSNTRKIPLMPEKKPFKLF